jgi:uncharacterized protein YndB with AHSA1/START domain
MTTRTEIEPIRKSISVKAPVERAFATFTDGITQWWPLDTHSVGAGRDGVRAEEAAFEGRVGGRLYERMSDGQEASWGEVVAWEPPNRIVLTWHPGYEDPSKSTEIEVRFTPEGDGTRVELEHRGWERLGERAVEAQAGYSGGWEAVLRMYAAAASG